MEYYNIFFNVVVKELSKFKLDPGVYSNYVSQLTPALDENFDIPYNRCAYMYRYATGFTFFFNDCVKKFFAAYSHTVDLFSKWKSYSKVKAYSLSVGPGLDYLAFMLAVLEYDSVPNNFDISVVTKYGAWRNTASLMLEVFSEQISEFKVSFPQLKYQNVKVIQSDLFKNDSNNVNDAHIILMMKTLNLLAAGSTQEASWLHTLKKMISSLKPETIIFCIDTKPSLAVITQALSQFPGNFLYGPIHQTVQLPAVFPEVDGNHPIISVRGAFFVWQKINTLTADTCNSPSKNIAEENKVNNLSTVSNSGGDCDVFPVVENATKVETSDADNDVNLPWVKLKSFWKSSSPKTRELLQRVMLTEEGNLEEINELISRAEKLDINEKCSMGTDQTKAQEDNKLDDTNIILTPSQSKMHELSENNKKNAFETRSDLHSDNSGSPSPSDTLNSVSSFTCENNSSSKSVQPSDYSLPIASETSQIYPQSSENSMNINTKKSYVKLLPSADKTIQTDTLPDIPATTLPDIPATILPDIPATTSSVKALTDKIRQLAISLESVPQHNDPSNNSGGHSFSFNQRTEGAKNCTHPTDKPSCSTQSQSLPSYQNYMNDKPSCSKQPPSYGCQESHSLPSYQNYMNDKPSCSKQPPSYGYLESHSLPSYQGYRNAPHQNMGCHCSCQCSRNGHMNCCLQPCCVQSIPRCSFACNHQHSSENNLPNVTSPNIVIPLQNISDNVLLQIISILKSEYKK